MKLSVVVPCYNESKNLHKLVSRFREVLGSRRDIEILFVENGSRDDSAQVFTESLSHPENCFGRMVRVPVNRGYGYGIRCGLAEASGDFLGWTHADLQTDPIDMVDAWERLCLHHNPRGCFVRGRRIGRNFFDAAFTTGMSCISSLVLGTWLHDINAQPKIFSREFYQSWHQPPDDFSLDLFVLFQAKRQRMNIVEVPVNFHRRLAGEAKGGGSLKGKFRLIQRTWKYIFKLRESLRSGGAERNGLRRAA